MNNFQKLILYWAGTALVVILAVFLVVSTDHILNTAATTNTVSFSGEGKVTAKPDVAIIDVAIVTEAITSKAAQDENSQKSQKVVDYLKKQNIEEKDIKTTGYNIYPQYSYAPTVAPKIKGYQVNQNIQVKIRNLENVSQILDGVTTAGANQINNLRFTIDNPEALKAQARQQAINDAKKKANELKQQLNIRLGRIINFQENTGGYPVPMYYDLKVTEVDGRGGGGPDVPSGENEIIVDVSITYQIK